MKPQKFSAREFLQTFYLNSKHAVHTTNGLKKSQHFSCFHAVKMMH